MTTTVTTSSAAPTYPEIAKAIARHSFAVLATVSASHRPHAAGVIYAEVDGVLYVSTKQASRKARNIADNPAVFVTIPVRRMPFGPPPSSIQFAGTAELVSTGHPDIVQLARAGRLKTVTAHGELDLAGGCFVRIVPDRTIHTYGLGLSLRSLARDPLNAAGRVSRPA